VIGTWGWTEWGFVVGSGAIHVLYFITLLRGYRKSDLTVVYPLARGSGPLISSVAALFILNEQISLVGWFGIAGVVLGVFLIAGGPQLTDSLLHTDPHSARHRIIRKGITYGILTGIWIAAYTVVDGYAVKVLKMPPLVTNYYSAFIQIALLLPTLFKDLPQTRFLWRQQWKPAVIVATISPASYILVLTAMQSAPLSHVAPAREVSMLFAALIGGRLLGEGSRTPRLLGALCIAAGVVALGLGA
jgi:drug/metabolite transporter (DMT)-like permease